MRVLLQPRKAPITADEITQFTYNMIGGCLQLRSKSSVNFVLFGEKIGNIKFKTSNFIDRLI